MIDPFSEPWFPVPHHAEWRVGRYETAHKVGPLCFTMKDGAPLTFWNEASAQLKADALNRKQAPYVFSEEK